MTVNVYTNEGIRAAVELIVTLEEMKKTLLLFQIVTTIVLNSV